MPLLAYFSTVALDGNGFVASFVAGVAFRSVHGYAGARRRRRATPPRPVETQRVSTGDYRLLEDTTTLLTGVMWFAVGTAAVVALDEGVPWRVLLYCLAALTVVRVVPALLALTRSSLPRRDRLLVAVLGPRGTTTIVFGLLAFNGLPTGPDADTVLLVTVVCVLASVLLQGPVAGGLARRFLRDEPDRPDTGAPPDGAAAARPVLGREDG